MIKANGYGQQPKRIALLLKEAPGKKHTSREIAKKLIKKYPEIYEEKRARGKKRSEGASINQVSAEVASLYTRNFLDKYPQIKTIEEYPRKFYWTDKSDQEEVAEAEEKSTDQPTSGETQQKERELYPKLCSYLWFEHGLYPKRIDEKRSSNKRGRGGNKWLYPDLVAMENLTKGWGKTIKNVAKQHSANKTRLWSFEVKDFLNASNVREAFFQAVSNSSWANFGYLAAAEVRGADTMKELQILCSLHGIGLILIARENPIESRIHIPAREKFSVNWATCNRIAEENIDFKQFLERIIRFHQTDHIDEGTLTNDWDIEEEPKELRPSPGGDNHKTRL